ncbi:MAG: cyclase [Lysobacteraceae bacterium]|nr:MAG: cyclase [Xanthomonadaceae bacterium]
MSMCDMSRVMVLLMAGLALPVKALDITAYALVDLSHTYDQSTLYWPTSPSAFEKTTLAYGETEGGFFYAANSVCTPEHGGTHIDAPIHFFADRATVDQLPLSQLMLPAVVIDISDQANNDANYRLTQADLAEWEEQHGRVPAGVAVLLRTDWSARWPDALSYLGDDTPGDASNLHFPSFGSEAARILVEQRKVAMLGVDTASIDYGQSTDFLVHRIAAEHNVPGLENLTSLDQLPAVGAWVIALPIKISGGSGAPVRVAALVP